MPDKSLDVVAVGNAIVDILTQADDTFLSRHNLKKGAMTLMDSSQAEALYAAMGPGVEVSGGSAANTIAGIASLGGRTAFIGKVRDDQLGTVYMHDLRALGVEFPAKPARQGPGTGRCYILVTPDAQRTMNTYLGAAVELGPTDVDTALVARAKVLYLEGYLWDRPDAKDALRKAADAAHAAGTKVAFSLSDAFCVHRWRDEFRALIRSRVDILFANETEITALYEVNSFEQAVPLVRKDVEVAALTRSEQGAVIVHGDKADKIAAERVAKVVDTTGAGDLYAAGFLSGYVQGKDLATCGRMGAIAAAEVISHFGARPVTPLKDLMKKTLGATA
jgi:sugar/nucleoside kinase (ribokinase family)